MSWWIWCISWPFASQISLVRTDTHAIQARQVRLAALAIPPHNRLMALLLRWADYRDTFKLPVLYISSLSSCLALHPGTAVGTRAYSRGKRKSTITLFDGQCVWTKTSFSVDCLGDQQNQLGCWPPVWRRFFHWLFIMVIMKWIICNWL